MHSIALTMPVHPFRICGSWSGIIIGFVYRNGKVSGHDEALLKNGAGASGMGEGGDHPSPLSGKIISFPSPTEPYARSGSFFLHDQHMVVYQTPGLEPVPAAVLLRVHRTVRKIQSGSKSGKNSPPNLLSRASSSTISSTSRSSLPATRNPWTFSRRSMFS